MSYYYHHSTHVERRRSVLRCVALMIVGAFIGVITGVWASSAAFGWREVGPLIGGFFFGWGLGRLLALRYIWRIRDAERQEWDRRIL